MIYKDKKLHIKYVVNIIFDGASPWNYLQTTEMGSLMNVCLQMAHEKHTNDEDQTKHVRTKALVVNIKTIRLVDIIQNLCTTTIIGNPKQNRLNYMKLCYQLNTYG